MLWHQMKFSYVDLDMPMTRYKAWIELQMIFISKLDGIRAIGTEAAMAMVPMFMNVNIHNAYTIPYAMGLYDN